MADWDFLDEVDVLAKLPESFKENLESKKWLERKEALQSLADLITANPRLSTKANYGEIVNTLQTVLAKDANINVNALAAKCIAGIAAGLRTKFAPYAQQIIPIIAERFKEKKPILRDPLIECIDAIAATVQLESLCDEIVAGMEKPNPQIKLQLDNFLFRQMNKITPDKAPRKLIKAVVPVLTKHASDADADVREGAFGAIGSIQRIIGEKNVKSMIGDMDEAKTKKIAEFAQKCVTLHAESKTAEPQAQEAAAPSGGGAAPAEAASARPAKAQEEADPWDFAEPFDLMSKIPPSFEGEAGIDSKKWQERRDALQALDDLLQVHVRLCPKAHYGELVGTLRKVLEKDANINVCALAAKLLTRIAKGLRQKFGQYAQTILPVVLDKLKEKKPLLRDPLIECSDAVLASSSFEALVEEIVSALGKPNPNVKMQSALFVRRAVARHNATSLPKKAIKAVAPLLVKHTGDSDAEVREAACAALGATMAVIGEKAAATLIADIIEDKLKMTKIREFADKIREEIGDVVVAAPPAVEQKAPPAAAKPPPKKEKEAAKEEVDEDEPPKEAPKKEEKVVKKKVKEEDEEKPVEEEEKKKDELLSVNDDKQQRIRDEKSLKILKWNFAMPDEEHTSQLMTLLGANAKTSLVALLFHKDFKMHIKAIEMIIKAADSCPASVVRNSDLLLKWASIRFFDTNPSVLIKVLEMCRVVVEQCAIADEVLSTEEVSAFVPYLLLKTGEPKETMRVAVREIMEGLTTLTGPLKLVPYILDALKTKNSRQRAECLQILEKYISTVGLAQFKALGVVKALASCVGDRDTNVRNAAINGLVACYREDGEKIYTLTGKMADKDKALVDERIKRTGAMPGTATPAQNKPGPRIVSQQNGTAVRPRQGRSKEGFRDRDESPDEVSAMNSTFNRGGGRKKFTLDDEDEKANGGEHQMTLSTVMATLDREEPPPPAKAPPSLKRSNSSSSIASIDTLDQLDKVIQNVSSALPDVAGEALAQVRYLLDEDEHRGLIIDRLSLLLPAIAAQMRLVRMLHLQDEKSNERIRSMLNFLTKFVNSENGELRGVKAQTLEPLMLEMVSSLADDNMSLLSDYSQISRSLNVIIIRFCTKSDPTAFFSAVVSCLHSTLSSPKDVSTELFCRCLYKYADQLAQCGSRIQGEAFATAVDSFFAKFTPMAKAEGHYGAAIKALELCTERYFMACSGAGDAFRRTAKHPHTTQLVARLAQTVASIPGQVEDGMANMALHPLVQNTLKDFIQMSKTVAMLGDHLRNNPTERGIVEKQLNQVFVGDLILEKLLEYEEHRKGKGEPPIYPTPPYLERLNMQRALVERALGVAGVQYAQDQNGPLETRKEPSMAPSTVSNDISPPQDVPRKRRSMNPAEIAPLKQRLNQIS